MTASRTAGSAMSAELAAMPLVWMYHSIAPYDEDPYEVTMTPKRFDKQMRWLRRCLRSSTGSGRQSRPVSCYMSISSSFSHQLVKGRADWMSGNHSSLYAIIMPVCRHVPFRETAVPVLA